MGKWCSNSGRVVLKQRADGAWVPIFAQYELRCPPREQFVDEDIWEDELDFLDDEWDESDEYGEIE